MNLTQKLKQIKSGKLTALKNLMQFSEKIATEKTKDLNIFLHLNERAIEQAKAIDTRIKNKKPTGKLAGLCFSVKSNICVQNITTNCASKVLENFVAPFNATVINKLISEDAILIGMVNMDEFACGWSGETSAFGPTKNPHSPQLVAGGSSSGSAAAVAANLCDFTLGSDTGGSIRVPASHCGVTGLKPTYGAVSRYGLIDMCMSFDQIGPLTKTVEDAELIYNVIKGQDNFDPTTVSTTEAVKRFTFDNQGRGERFALDKGKIKSKSESRIGRAPSKVIGLVNTGNFCNKEIENIIKEKADQLAKEQDWKIKSVNLPLDIALQTYFIIVFTEFFSATRKFDGRRFGSKIEDVAGPEVVRRIFGGSEISQAEHGGKYYRNALKARNYVKEQFQKIFKDVDFLILPTVPRTAHKIGENISLKEMHAYDILTVLANIAGLPAISIPAGDLKGKKVGLQIMAPHFHEDVIFEVGKFLE